MIRSPQQPWKFPPIVGISLAGILWVGGQSLLAQERSASDEQLIALVQNLDSARFSVREHASKELVKIGEPAVKLLSEISPNSSFELRQRALQIRRSIENTLFDAVSREFLLDLDASRSHGLPGWRSFSAMVGSSRTGKLLFLEIVREQRQLAELIEAADAERQLGKDNQLALGELATQAVGRAESMAQRLYELPSPGIGESAGLLFAAAVVEGPAPIEVNRVVSRVAQVSFYGHLRKQGYNECLKAMLSQWIPKTHASMAPEVMVLALELDLPSVAPTARLNLSDNFDVYTRELAFRCLAKFGNETDIAIISTYFEDTKIVDEFVEAAGGILSTNAAPPGVGQADEDDRLAPGALESLPTYVVRVKDVAVLTAMLLMNEEPANVFPNYLPSETRMNTHALAATEANLKKQDALIKLWIETHLRPGNAG